MVKGGNLLVRKSYVDLYDLWMKNKDVYIGGNPGIGKSCFLTYVLYRLSQLNARIILHTVWKKKMFLFSGRFIALFVNDNDEGVFTLREPDKFMEDPNNFYLVDGVHPEGAAAKTLLVTSPRREIYRDFQKLEKVATFFMPIWTFEEIKEARVSHKSLLNDFRHCVFRISV